MRRAISFLSERRSGTACACAAVLAVAAAQDVRADGLPALTAVPGMQADKLKPLTVARDVRSDKLKKDGKWHGNASLSLSYATGNTRSSSLAVSVDAARHTEDSKLSFYLQALGTRAENTANGVATTATTANQWKGGGRYDRNISEKTFGFVALDMTHDRIQLLSLRSVASLGSGYHLIHTEETHWNLLGGISYRDDRYNVPGVMIHDRLHLRFNTAQLLLGEESSSRPTSSTTLRQRLIVMPNLGAAHGGLVNFNASIMVAINASLSLKVTIQDRYNSLSQPPIRKNDFLLLTGLNLKFDS